MISMGKKLSEEQRLDRLDRQLAVERRRLELTQTKLQQRVVRERLKMLSTYAAAGKDRTVRDWQAKKKTADQAIIPDSATLNARAREGARDNWAGRSIIRAYCRNVVGKGITPRSNARDPETGEPFEEFNRRIDALWARWARDKKLCDVEGHRTFVGCEHLAMSEFVTVGESLTYLAYEPRRDMVGLMLQMFEPEQLDDRKVRSAEGNDIRGGVEVDVRGRAIAYWLYTQAHPWDKWAAQSTRVSADDVLHLFLGERVRQTRGVSQMTPSLLKIQHLSQYDLYQLIAARLEACIGGFIKREYTTEEADNFGLPVSSGSTGTDAQGASEITFEPAMLPKLAPGEEFTPFIPQRPGNMYDPFWKAQVAQIAAGAGLDYASVARDFHQGTYSSQRQSKQENRKEWDVLQNLMIDDWCRRIREPFKTYAVLEGRVEAPGFFEDAELQAAYLEDDWQPGPDYWIDPLKEMKARQMQLESRLGTYRSMLNEDGLSWQDEFRQQADEKKLADELGIPLPVGKATGGGSQPNEFNGLSRRVADLISMAVDNALADYMLTSEE
jgi:lambda family phage portal protein